MTHVLRRLADLSETSPERVLVRIIEPRGRCIFRDAEVTAGSWASGASACAETLKQHGVGNGDRVLVALPTSEAFLHAFWGVVAAGAIPIPLPSHAGWLQADALGRRIANIVEDAAPRAAFADAATGRILRGDFSAARPRKRSEAERGRAERSKDFAVLAPPSSSGRALSVPDLDDDSPALIQYTSGSTGRPKGVAVTHANLRANVESAAKVTRIDPYDRVLSWLPLYHDMGLIGGLIIPMWSGATAYLMSPLHFLLSPATWLQALSSYRATVTIAPNFAFSLMAKKIRDEDLEGIDLSSLRLALNGAEPVDRETMEAFCGRFASRGFDAKSYYPVYGLAEATLAAAFPPCGREPIVDRVDRTSLTIGSQVKPSAAPHAVSFVSVGRALPGHELVIADPADGTQLAERHLGEILVKGPSITPYYLSGGKRHQDRRGALRTGDLGYLVNGELYVVDRMKDLIIVAGRSYVPSDLERIVETVEDVRTGRSVAFGVWEPSIGTEKLVVVAEVRPALLLRTARIEQRIKKALEREVGLSPAEIVLVRPHSLETTSSGKLMRESARTTFGAAGFEKPYGMLHPSWIRARLARLWARSRAEPVGA